MGILNLSCVTTKPTIGDYRLPGDHITLRGDHKFEYRYTSEGLGRREWAFGTWERIADGRIKLVSYAHDNLPIKVVEDRYDIEGNVIILPEWDSGWDANTFVYINGIKIKVERSVIFLSTTEFSEIKTIFVEVSVTEENTIYELVNYTLVKTSMYLTKDPNNNVFRISYPISNSTDGLHSCLYFGKVNDTITVKKNNLIWNGYKYPRVRPSRF